MFTKDQQRVADRGFPTYAEWLINHTPLAGREGDEGSEGGSGEGGGEGSGDGDGEGDGAGASGSGGSGGQGSGQGSGSGSGSGGDGGEGDGEYVRIPKAEADRLKKESAAFQRKAKETEAAAKKDREKQMAEQGRWQDVAKENEEAKTTAEKERDDAREELTNFKREVRANGIAQRLGFMDPRDVFNFAGIRDASDDDKQCEAALRKLAKEKPYLVNPRMATGGAGGGTGSGNGLLTMDQIKQMTPDEVNANWAAVQKAMTAAGANN